MSEQLSKYQKKLPSINELYSTDLELLDKQNDLNLLLNQEPKKDWMKDHPIAKVEVKDASGNKVKAPVKYLPIERVEWLLTNIFISWKFEILREGLIANSAYVTGRLHYRNPITGEWDWMDGTGAQPLQTESGAGATEFDKIKSSAVQIGLPAAESYAVKDAAEKLGKLFGKDMNRADKIAYDTLYGKFDLPASDLEGLKKQYIELIDKQDKDLANILKNEVKEIEKSGKLTIEKLTELIGKQK